MVENETAGGHSMAFEIEALTTEQREQFAAKQIPDPLSPVFVCNRRASGLPE